jgi:hypothetical protein
MFPSFIKEKKKKKRKGKYEKHGENKLKQKSINNPKRRPASKNIYNYVPRKNLKNKET